MKDLAKRETEREKTRRDPSRNQNNEIMPISELEWDDEGERDERGMERESSEPKKKREKSSSRRKEREKRENSVRERNDILMERLIKYYYFL